MEKWVILSEPYCNYAVKEYSFDSISQAASYFNIDKRSLARALKRKNQVYSHFKITKI